MFHIDQILKDELVDSFSMNEVTKCFSFRNSDEIFSDKYESFVANIDFYTWLAYGNVSGQNEAKNVYFRINDLLQKQVKENQSQLILDVGFGVARILFDSTVYFKETQLIGFDYSVNMLKRAKQILVDGEQLNIDFSSSGLKAFKINGKKQNNVHLLHRSFSELPFQLNSMVVVVNTFLIDRVRCAISP